MVRGVHLLLHIPGAIWKPQRKAVAWQDSLPVSCWLARPLPQRALVATLKSTPPSHPPPRALKPPSSLVCSPLPRCSLPPHTKPTHVLSNTHRYTHLCKDTSYSFPLQGRVRGAAPGILPVSPLPPSALYMSILLAQASKVL